MKSWWPNSKSPLVRRFTSVHGDCAHRSRLLRTVSAGLIAILASTSIGVGAEDFNAQQEELLQEIGWPGSMKVCIGITRRGTRLWCVMDKDALDYRTNERRILAVAGLEGSETNFEAVNAAVLRLLAQRNTDGAGFRFAIVPLANPDGYFLKTGSKNSSGGDPTHGYPPEGTAYNSPTDPERMHIWRFAGWFAPDLLVEMQSTNAADWQQALRTKEFEAAWAEDSLASAVRRESVAGFGMFKSARQVVGLGDPDSSEQERQQWLYAGFKGQSLFDPIERPKPVFPLDSWPRFVAEAHLERSPHEVLNLLADYYGGDLDKVSYQPALAVMCRARLGDLTRDQSKNERVAAILEPYLSGKQPSLSEKASGSEVAGHLVFADWAVRTGDERAIALVLQAADVAFDKNGQPLEAMPFHNEMSDAVFMACPILCAAGRLTGAMKYFDMAERHLNFMQKLCRREDGIYRHSPLCEAAWGRGNGFPALGLTLSIVQIEDTLKGADLSQTDKSRLEAIAERFRRDLRAHLTALIQYQDVTGMWQQVIDEPGSYRELTCTCMIGYSIVEGIRRGWLNEAEFGPVVRRAWEGVNLRIGGDGRLVDVCTGTGKQKSLRDYLDRTAIHGRDERGGAMAMLFADQIAEWEGF